MRFWQTAWRCAFLVMVRHRRTQASHPGRAPGGTISGRLIGILALPVLAVLVLVGVVVVGELGQYRGATGIRESVNLALSTQDVVQDLQQERGLTSGLLAGDTDYKPELAPSRQRVDASRAALARKATSGIVGAQGVRAALDQLSGLDGIRAQIDTGKIRRATAFSYFTQRISQLAQVDFGLDRSADRTLRRGVDALSALSDSKEFAAQEQAYLNGVFAAGGFKPGEFVEFATIQANLNAAQARSFQYATPAQTARGMRIGDTGAASEARTFQTEAMAAGDGRPLQIDPQSWWSGMTTVIDDMRELQQSYGADIQQRARVLENNATRRLAILLGGAIACLAGALILMIVASRSITGPLRKLATEADALATQRLPEAVARVQSAAEDETPPPPQPVQVTRRASSEIHSVAQALERVQGTAYALATEQAMLRRITIESLANLGRRNQNLLRRQIGFITKLEQEEHDPSGLANLFELDHLATRMRRNAESLLVLVGEASPRRWSAPLPIVDVIRAAVSEVEEYRRVSLRRIDDLDIVGTHATSLAHMIAELVENGLVFSPPDVEVEIQGRRLGNEYLIAITDQGVGMEPDDLARANARLRGEESFLVAPTRFLGHYVVGHLARQMSIDVELRPSPVTGITARVTLPSALLSTPGTIEAGPASLLDAHSPHAVTQSVPQIVSPAAGAPAVPGLPSPATVTPGGAQPLPSRVTIDGWHAPVADYITVAEVGQPVTVPAAPAQWPDPAPAQWPDPAVRADTIHPDPAPVVVDVPVVVEPAFIPAVSPSNEDGPAVERTQNGLIKRPRHGRPIQPGPEIAPGRERPAVMDESPQELRNRLVSLRAGILRGESRRADGDGPAVSGGSERAGERSES
jgi:anti-sigma regulatory factor (Ser/Thr protein kinase)